MADGGRKPIEDIRSGDKVIATDPATGRTGPESVIAHITSRGDKRLVRLEIDTDGNKGGQAATVISTAQHPFWSDQHGWIEANNVTVGTQLRTHSGRSLTVIGAWHYYQSRQTVHNLLVEEVHTYYVLTGDQDVLVHNAGICGGAIVAESKFDYLLGGKVAADPHNGPRAIQNANQFARVGVYNTAEGRAILQDHFDEVVGSDSNIVRTYTDQYGTFQVRDSLLSGPNGFLHLETTWQVTENGLRLTTVIPRGGL